MIKIKLVNGYKDNCWFATGVYILFDDITRRIEISIGILGFGIQIEIGKRD